MAQKNKKKCLTYKAQNAIIKSSNKERHPIKGWKVEIMIIKEITKKEFEEKFPEVSTYGYERHMPVYLENGAILSDDEWNGLSYTVKDENGAEKRYRPVEEPTETDDDGEAVQWDIVGYEEV